MLPQPFCDVTLTVAESHRQSSLEGSLDAAEVFATRHQVVTRAVERSEGRVAHVVAVTCDIETVAGVKLIFWQFLVTAQRDVSDGRIYRNQIEQK